MMKVDVLRACLLETGAGAICCLAELKVENIVAFLLQMDSIYTSEHHK